MGLLEGKVAVITGSGGESAGRKRCCSRAKGRSRRERLGGARDGAGQSTNMADEVVLEIAAQGGTAVANYDSVATSAGAENIVKSAVGAFGRLDVFVNNAGILRDKTLLKMDEAMWDAVIAVHLKGTFLCTQAAARQMINQGGGGRIVNTTSLSGMLGNFGQANYSAAKAASTG